MNEVTDDNLYDPTKWAIWKLHGHWEIVPPMEYEPVKTFSTGAAAFKAFAGGKR